MPPVRCSERLTEYAHQVQQTAQQEPQQADAWRSGTLRERIDYAMLKGVADHIEEDALEAYANWTARWR